MDRDTIGDLADSTPFGGDDADYASRPSKAKTVTERAFVVTQGKHRFYSVVLPSDLLAQTCAVEARAENPIDGFQRLLDERRAKSIARYIDAGFGTVPGAVVLSAQARAHLTFDKEAGALTFRKDPRAFLIIDGQHRVFGFKLAKSSVSVPVVIYNRLTRAQECRLFMDINTKQRPVPNELLLDIRRLSEVETETEALLHNVFDLFNTRKDSALAGLLSASERKKGMISRVTFNAALRSIKAAFVGAPAEEVYPVLNAYLRACRHGLGLHAIDENIANPALFKALMLLFTNVAERVADRHGGKYTVGNFEEVLIPFFRRLKKSDLPRAGMTHIVLHEHYSKALSAGFNLKQWLFA
ncbi:DGQHR domain-containing protein [Methylocystis parvus]|uniref:DGQHR domain-containing protein n=1 Tax=Methylocystis parvus TaxID=134 RepID=A0A6B8MAB1_9HYPH|nr:DGQHR domain-containing protein [Methylocystis parvus]QGM98223.1 DGQHR domain-containing protein [Methylocystis parvus]WBK01449.1 DGQHR domain-containing protein [Methylocystis parvus OBBP]